MPKKRMSSAKRKLGLTGLVLAGLSLIAPSLFADNNAKKPVTWFLYNKVPYEMQINNGQASPENDSNIILAEDKNGKWFNDSSGDGIRQPNENYAPAGFTLEASKTLKIAKEKTAKGAKVLYHFTYKNNEFVRWDDGTMTFGPWELDQQWVSLARKNGVKNAGLMSPAFNSIEEKDTKDYINGLNEQISSYESQTLKNSQVPTPKTLESSVQTPIPTPQIEQKDLADLRTEMKDYNSQQTQKWNDLEAEMKGYNFYNSQQSQKISDLQSQIESYGSQQTQKMNELQTQVNGLESAVQSAGSSLAQIISAQTQTPSGTQASPSGTTQPSTPIQPSGITNFAQVPKANNYDPAQAEQPVIQGNPVKIETPKVQGKQSKLELYINALGGPGWVGVTEDADGNTVLTNNLPNSLSSPSWDVGGELGLTGYSKNGFGFGVGLEVVYGFPETLLNINIPSTSTVNYLGNKVNQNFLKIGLTPEIQLGKGKVKAILGLEGALWIYNQNKSSGFYDTSGKPVPSPNPNEPNPVTENTSHYDLSGGGEVGIKIDWFEAKVEYDLRKGFDLKTGVSIQLLTQDNIQN